MGAIISYNIHSQKIPYLYRSLLTPDILKDITMRVTGQPHYELNEIATGYNHGRLIYITYQGIVNYVSLSEIENAGRNSSLQSVPTALNLFYSDSRPNKRLFYYFLPHSGNLFTDYHLLYYRMMMTAKIQFLNIDSYSPYAIYPYRSVDDFIDDRNDNRSSNRGNNSSFVTRTADRIQIYAKVYGANKYESTIIAIALSQISLLPIDLFAVAEQDLVDLPASSKRTLQMLGIRMYQTSLTLNNSNVSVANEESLRDAAFNYNLLNRLGPKCCAVCGCPIPEIIQGAHIWAVSDIKRSGYSLQIKYHHATSEHNGLWLCQNHHKLFDSDLMVISPEGQYLFRRNLPHGYSDYLTDISCYHELNSAVMSDDFRNYLHLRNQGINFANYESF